MDEYDQDNLGAPPDGEEDAYKALNDPRRVMMEVVALVEELHHAVTRLGDAIAAAGLPARDWRDAECRLLLLADQFPDITLDALITRLAEFSAGMGPDWLHGGREDIAHFNDEAAILYGVVRPLRTVAQRLRMVPARERSDLPIERALGDARVGTSLDRAAALLRDLESLGPFIVPLAPKEWDAPAPEPAPSPYALEGDDFASQSAPRFGGRVTVPQPRAPGPPLPVAQPPATSAATASAAPGASSPQTFRRLRDFLPPPEEREQASRIEGRDWSWLRADVAMQGRALLAWVKPRKWLVVGCAIMLLGLGTALLTLARQSLSSAATTPTPISHLVVSPAQITLACSGKNDTLKLTLRDTGTQPLTWSIKTPSGLSLSATHGTLKPSASASITIKVTSAKAAHGSLAFTSNDGEASVPYAVSCK